jgi:Protein of unknown function (DUF3667)
VSGPPACTSVCTNCGAALQGPFCSACGQNHRHERLRVADWVGDIVDGVTNLESRILRTAIDLTRRPGRMARDYVEGRRAYYVSPTRYAIGTCALWLLTVSANREAAAIWYVEYGQLINLASLPVMAWLMYVAFLGSSRNYAEHLAYMFFISGHVFLWRAVLALANFLPNFPPRAAILLALFDQVLFVAYLIWSMLGFHRGVRWRGLRIAAAIVLILVFGVALNVVLQQATARLSG